MNAYFFIMEFGAILSLLAITRYERREPRLRGVLGLAFMYGIILEALNIYMSRTYAYSPDFIFQVFDVPVAIGAGWAVIYYLSWKGAEKFKLAWWQAPFLMALIALSYDLAIDAIAIRLGFWSWKIPLDEEWFGVPYDNFFGWLAVVWTFALAINLSFQNFIKPALRKIIRYSAPITSSLLLGMQIMLYVNISAVFSGSFSWSEAIRMYAAGEYYYAYIPEVQAAKEAFLAFIVFALSSLCFFWMRRKKIEPASAQSYLSLRLSSAIHLTFIIFILTSGIFASTPILLMISIGAFSFNLLLERPLRQNSKKTTIDT